jgi:hypothetical protein
VETAQTLALDAEDVLCPLCGYNLRGLPEARCPECGGKFDWGELRDPTRRKHPYLFEHHPRRNVVSFVRTFLAGLLPRRFWRTLSPVQPSRPGRLVIYWFLCLLLCSVAFLCEFFVEARQLYQFTVNQRALTQKQWPFIAAAQRNEVVKQFGSLQNMLDQSLPLPPSIRFVKATLGMRESGSIFGQYRPYTLIEIQIIACFWTWLIWPFATVLIMLIFRASMKRARVRSIHLLRVTIYSTDAIVWIGLFWLLLFIGDALEPYARVRLTFSPGVQEGLLGWCFAILAIVLTYRLGCAMGKYLQFRHAMAMAISVQVILILLALQISLYLARKHG